MEKLRPNNTNGDTFAFASIALAVAVLVTMLRLSEPWAATVNFIYTAAAAILVLSIAYLWPVGRARPKTNQTVMYVAGLGLAAIALINLKDVLGGSSPGPAGTRVWILLVLLVIAGYLSWFRKSGVMTLFAGLIKIALILSLVEWIFQPDNVAETNRWFLAILAFLFVGVVVLFDVVPAKYRQVAVVDAGGFALLALSFSFLQTHLLGLALDGSETSAGWEIIIGLGSLMLIGYAMLAGDAGPGYLGGFNLIAFSLIVASTDDPSFVWWPLILLIIAIAAFAAAFTGQKIPRLSDVPPLEVSTAKKKPAAKK